MESVARVLPEVRKLDNDLLETIKKKTEEINNAKAELVKQLQPTFKEMFMPFLTKYPQVKRIQWTQYTPYFNDGSECVFSVNDLNGFLETVGECDYEGSLPDGWLEDIVLYRESGAPSSWTDWKKKYIAEKSGKYPENLDELSHMSWDFNELRKTFDAIPEDIMRDLFGDHAKIVVTAKGLDVEEYEHD